MNVSAKLPVIRNETLQRVNIMVTVHGSEVYPPMAAPQATRVQDSRLKPKT